MVTAEGFDGRLMQALHALQALLPGRALSAGAIAVQGREAPAVAVGSGDEADCNASLMFLHALYLQPCAIRYERLRST